MGRKVDHVFGRDAEADADILVLVEGGHFIGTIANMPNRVYHRCNSYISSTQLKYLYSNSPFHYKKRYIDMELEEGARSTAMLLGSAVHTRCLEPEKFNDEFFVYGKIDGRSKEGKEQKEYLKEIAKRKELLTTEENDVSLLMRDAVMARAHHYFEEPGDVELSIFWKCPFSGLKMRAKIDRLNTTYFLDLKTTRCANPKSFERDFYNLHYDLQAYHYQTAIEAAYGVRLPMKIVAVENSAPYVAERFDVSEDFMETGHEKWIDAVSKLEYAFENGVWYSYVNDEIDPIPELLPPKWLRKEVDEISVDDF